MSRASLPLAERFWVKVDRRGPDECWPWKASKHRLGYGFIRVDGVCTTASRVALYLHTGEWPRNACHRCDNPGCVNPAHLYDGSVADNMRDCVQRGRFRYLKPQGQSTGERNGQAKLSEDDVRAIRRERAEGVTLSTLSKKYGVGSPTISMIARRLMWRHVP